MSFCFSHLLCLLNRSRNFWQRSVNTCNEGLGEPPKGQQAVCVSALACFTQMDSNAIISLKKKNNFETLFNEMTRGNHFSGK